MDLELSLGMNGIKMLKEILTGLVMVENVFFLVAAVHMRHAEFEECMAHEAFVKEMKRHIRKFNRRHLNFKTLGKRNLDRPQKK